MTAKRIRVLALATYPVEAASSRYRLVQFIEPLRLRGIDVEFAPFLDRALFESLYQPGRMIARLPGLSVRLLRRLADAWRSADVVFVQREAMLFGPPVVEWLATHVRRRPLVLDLDDPTWVPYASPVYGRAATVLKWPSKTDWLIDNAHTVTCGSPHVASYAARRGTRAVLIPTVVDLNVFRRSEHSGETPLVGWIGSHGTYPYLERLFRILESLAEANRFRLAITGSGRRDLELRGIEVDQRPWRMETEAEDFRSLDVGLYPIDDDEWGRGKSGFKAVQYMACGVPFVMSPVGVCATMGVPGVTHFAATTNDEWRDALQRLIADPQLRRVMGEAGRTFAEQNYSLDRQADGLASVLREAAV